MSIVSLISISVVALLSAADPAFPPELTTFKPYPGNPIFTGAGAGHWDEAIRERGWILHEEDGYHLWYTGYQFPESNPKYLGYATSPDGLHWTRHPDNPIYSETWVEDMMIVKVEGTYYMFAEGVKDRAHLLTSTNRLHWEDKGTLDVRRANGKPLPDGRFGTPTAYYENGTWYLFYERNDEAIWLAASKDLKVWTNVQDDPVIPCGPEPYDKAMIALDQIVKYKGRYYAYFHGLVPNTKPGDWTSDVAVSSDLVHWTKYAGNPILRNDISSPELVSDGDQFRLYSMHPAICAYFPPDSPLVSAPLKK